MLGLIERLAKFTDKPIGCDWHYLMLPRTPVRVLLKGRVSFNCTSGLRAQHFGFKIFMACKVA